MSKERPFEDIVPVPNIKVGYFEKEAYLEIIDRQSKQIEAFAYQILALQSRTEILDKNQRPKGEWKDNKEYSYLANCSNCGYQMDTHEEHGYFKFCPNCGAEMRGAENE